MKVTHITIQTESAEQEIAFFETYAALRVQSDLRPMGKNIVFLAEKEGDTQLEIIEKPGAADSGNENLSIGFHTGDVEALRAALINGGFAPSPMISPMPQVKFFFVKDPAGVTVQFL